MVDREVEFLTDPKYIMSNWGEFTCVFKDQEGMRFRPAGRGNSEEEAIADLHYNDLYR